MSSNEAFLAQFSPLLIKSWPEGLIVLDTEGCIQLFNAHAEVLLGWKAEQLMGQQAHFYFCIESVDHEEDSCPLEALEDDTDEEVKDACWANSDGIYTRVDYKKVVIREKNQPVGLFISFKDCSERLFTEQELQRLALYPELVPLPMAELDEAGTIYYANASMMELILDLDYNDEGVPRALPSNLLTLLKESLSSESSFEDIHYNVDDFWFVWNFQPIPETNKVIVYGEDITEKILAQEEMLKAKEEAETSNEQKNKLFSIIAHDIRSPFTPILGFSSVLAENADQFEKEDIVDFSKKIHQSAQRVMELLGTLLDWSRLQLDKMELSPDYLGLKDMSEKSIRLYETMAAEKNVALSIDVEDIIVYSDRTVLDTLMRNLLGNAIKFTPKGGSVSLTSKAVCRELVMISVQDTGIGLSSENLKKILSPNSHMTTQGTNGEKGTGLGLSVCIDMLNKQGGAFSAESKEGEGSRFFFTIRRVNDDEMGQMD
jgi:two-component system, autoinducer 2 sensor kinase/phosphatase LuxQ